MNSQPNEPSPRQGSFRESLEWLTTIAWWVGTPLEVVLHRHIGARYLGFNALFGLLAILVIGAFGSGDQGAAGLMCFVVLYLVLSARARVAGHIRERRGVHIHSYSAGESRIARLAPRWSEARVQGVLEPAVVLLLGVVFHDLEPALGSYLLAGGVALAITQQVRGQVARARLMGMHDARIEARDAMERYRASGEEEM